MIESYRIGTRREKMVLEHLLRMKAEGVSMWGDAPEMEGVLTEQEMAWWDAHEEHWEF